MREFIKFTLFFLSLFLIMISSLKSNSFQNSRLEKNKLQQYFKGMQSNRYDGAVVNRKQLIEDSLFEIKQSAAKIDFVEVSEFTDSLSVRWITSDAISYSNFIKFNSKKSKHIGTTYMSVSKNDRFINNDLKRIVSVIEFNLMHKSSFKTKDLIGDYVTKNIKNCKVFYIRGGDYINTTSSNLGNSNYQFDNKQSDNDSLYIAQYLLNNYGFGKFKKLWGNGFSGFEEIYDVSFKKINENRNKIALLTSENQIRIDWGEFDKCM